LILGFVQIAHGYVFLGNFWINSFIYAI
jgi:hypothetical protein